MSKAKSKNSGKSHFVFVLVAMILLLVCIFGVYRFRLDIQDMLFPNDVIEAYQAASDALRERVTSDITDESAFSVLSGKCCVFLSYSNGQYRPVVRHAVAGSIDSAWRSIDRQIRREIRNSEYSVEYLKCDIVSAANTIKFTDLRDEISNHLPGQYHYGAAFDERFDTALLEQECNYYRLFDKETNNVLLSKLNRYLDAQSGQELEQIPSDVITFRCDSWLYEISDNSITRLSSKDDNYGIRDFELSRENISTLIATAGYYLVNNIDDSGEFLYAFWPQYDDDTQSYNVVRHIDALWALTQYYELTGDRRAQDAIKSGIDFLEPYKLQFGDAAYIRCTDSDEAPDEIRMGGSGLFLIVLSEYERLFGDDSYRELLNNIANGIIANIQENGHVTHVLDLNLHTKRDWWAQYYEGEDILGLCYAYGLTQNPEYLTAAQDIAQYCLDQNYAVIGDHWFSLAMNELTKYVSDDSEYYQAALLSVMNQMDDLGEFDADSTELEHLMGAFELYTRAIEHGIAIPSEFNIKSMTLAIKMQASGLLNNYLFPEKAMYSPCMTRIIGTFYSEYTESWKIRIDLIQHHMDAYYRILSNYDELSLIA